ncbi:MAG: long-chain fatty acid--CoA ligase [Rhodospirillaceae bacterium]|nr:long-chain fatty acid--CoA ligase [Rhodospirillaceae bacterium]
MMNTPLLITSLIQFAAQYHGDTSIVTRSTEGPVRHSSYGEVFARAQRLANALIDFGIKPGDRIATVAWNTDRHIELYYAISGIGAICHTVNLRLADAELVYILNHAEDRMVFFDTDMSETLARIQTQTKTVDRFVAMTDAAHLLDNGPEGTIDYESFIASASPHHDWAIFDENTAASMCYTSGTTGDPKGVLYSHRATVLHAMASCYASTLNLRTEDVVLPVVPMFHVNAWGVPYSAPIAGTPLVMPGPKLDGQSLFEFMDAECVTKALGVPTVWMSLLDHMDKVGRKPAGLNSVVIGGAAASEAIINRFELDHGVAVNHAWGMTEMSPLGVVNTLKTKYQSLPRDQQMPTKLKQGRAIYGVDLCIVDDDGQELPRDGDTSGRLLVKGPWIVSEYFKAGESALNPEGWFDTGDIATLDPDGYMMITDRAKDIIKSGGEWISSVGLENAAVGHPVIKQAAVIGVAHPKWLERPLLVCVPEGENQPDLAEIREYLAEKVPKLWLPDAIEWVESLPIGATGKVLKAELRNRFAGYTVG